MKIDSIKIAATIPTGQYANILPSIELSEVTLAKGTQVGLEWINNLYEQYSSSGALKRLASVPASIILASKKSFNEDVSILFEPVAHTYHYGTQKLISATEYIKKFYKNFDSKTISQVSAKAWGVDKKELAECWDSNGKLTSSFGSVVHAALEHYDKFKAMGEQIQFIKELPENYAMPKHPILKSIIEGFIAIDKIAGRIVPEALITDVESGYCGHADRILIVDKELKICRIQDYKVNINSEEVKKENKPSAPFDTLPANKISKYQLQMSFYANMLEKSGWTVEGLDVFIYENEWKVYSLEVLKVI